jgi:cellulose synthase/poly-beta-1,6-N-acetylglucosamine synthase-like glycosyltransferase
MSVLVTSLYVVAALCGAAFALAEFRLLVRFLRHRSGVREAARSTGPAAAEGEHPLPPTVTVQIPLYNERLTARRVILAAASQCYPADRFDIQVLDDSTDETTEVVGRTVSEVRSRGIRVEHVRRGSRKGYKAGAMAEGLQRSTADFVAVFDADFTPEPDFLWRAMVEESAFQDPTVAFLQARWSVTHAARGLFLSALALFLDRHFYVQKPTRAFAGQVTTFNGSAGIWRRAAIEAGGGWSADTLTEDLDLSYRCALAGWRGHYVHDISVPNELPGHMRAFKLQQRRWARGNAQCFLKLARRVLDSGNRLRDRWEEAFLLAGYGIHPVLLANLILWPWSVLYVDRTFFWGMQALMSLATLVAPVSFLITLHERGDRLGMDSVAQVLAGMCLGIGLMVNNSVGQMQGFLSRGGEFARTPKGRPSQDGTSLLRPYESPLHWTFFLELVVVAYCVATSALLVERGEALWALPMLFWGASVGLVMRLQLAPQAV